MNVSSYPNDLLVDDATYSFYLTISDIATNPITTLLQPVIYGTHVTHYQYHDLMLS